MTEITIPPFPKMGGHGGEPISVEKFQEQMIKQGKVVKEKIWKGWEDDRFWEGFKKIKITISQMSDGSFQVRVKGPNVTVVTEKTTDKHSDKK